ncbi:MAG: hypothetical protein DWB56_06795 [Candidatus Jettenia sp.]|uniref:Uncharacterized protein n=1 Tax=Candidatus Jettenia caeni TaxID=247490 RepID=I3IMZ2_9BACT|nr:hypothetical protein [Candidatus Jettenia sp. AMX1]MBC6928661.1 hypothetical protein [Candidatus Jettenia sp.]GAB63087.1 hypothetical protein KSU1_C1491 [Candidatus Jettenia caeni]KAA0250639.1 MAG: hypothetical protein EDM77_03735 [Candidatus Jettenia sp. AMX1]MCE7879973.1 hypothetical protein [Candidatus Jettenia sp. AMX1]MCQ3926755.1 hypothetical protein [Candidatus Jettenia sp.]
MVIDINSRKKNFLDFFESIRQMIQRTIWLRKYSSTCIIQVEGVGLRPHLCIFEEAVLGLTMKLQPLRCKDPNIAAKINERQEEMAIILKDVLKGNIPKRGFCNEELGLLPRPGLSMNTVPQLCKQANKGCQFSARALNFFFDMPVDDLIDDVVESNPNTSEISSLIVEYLEAILDDGNLPDVSYVQNAFTIRSAHIYKTFLEISRRRSLKKFFTSQYNLASLTSRERDSIESLGWRKRLESVSNGRRTYRFERILMSDVHND